MGKAVRFDYFKVYARRFDQTRNEMVERFCDLSNMLEQAQRIPVSERVHALGGDTARLQDITQNNNKWEMHFIRIRKNNFPLRTHDNGEINYFSDLAAEEGFGEEVSALFDPDNSVIMIRRNMFSLSPSGIATYFTDLVNEPGFTIFFKPLLHPSAIQLLKQDHLIRSVDVSIADVKNTTQRTKHALGSIINRVDDIRESVNFSFKISLNQKGSRKSSRLPIYEDIQVLAQDPNVTSIEIKQKADEDAKVESVDLIKHRLVDYYNFPNTDISEESRNILHRTVISRMHMLYRSRVQEINQFYV